MPRGSRRLTFDATLYAFQRSPIRLLTKTGRPITFQVVNQSISNDAEATVTPLLRAGDQQRGSAAVEVACGQELYFTLGSVASFDRVLENVTFSYEPSASCPADAGAPLDAGTPGESDAGTPSSPATIALVPDELGASAGCGCTAVPVPWLVLLALGARRRPRPARRGLTHRVEAG